MNEFLNTVSLFTIGVLLALQVIVVYLSPKMQAAHPVFPIVMFILLGLTGATAIGAIWIRETWIDTLFHFSTASLLTWVTAFHYFVVFKRSDGTSSS